jgi:hypothetical protein
MNRLLSALAVVLALGVSAIAQQRPPAFTPIPAPDNVAKPPADAAKTASGLASIVLQAGTGKEKPSSSDIVTVHYTGWTTDGKMFDSSFARNAPSSFPVDRVIKGWGEGVQLMVVGEKRRFWIPQEIAYNGRAPGRHAGIRHRAAGDSSLAAHAAARCGGAAVRRQAHGIGPGLQVAARRQRRYASE